MPCQRLLRCLHLPRKRPECRGRMHVVQVCDRANAPNALVIPTQLGQGTPARAVEEKGCQVLLRLHKAGCLSLPG